jgi:hypothetical protein
MQCDATGISESIKQTCSSDQYCASGGSCKAQVCTPNSVFCDGQKLMTCNANGSGSETTKDCCEGPTPAGDIGNFVVEPTSDASVFNAATDAWHVTLGGGPKAKVYAKKDGGGGDLAGPAQVTFQASDDGSHWTAMLTDKAVDQINAHGGVYGFSGYYKSKGPGPYLGFGLTDGDKVIILGTRGNEGEAAHPFTDWTITIDAGKKTATVTMDSGTSQPVDISSLSEWRFYAEGPANAKAYKYYLYTHVLYVKPKCTK